MFGCCDRVFGCGQRHPYGAILSASDRGFDRGFGTARKAEAEMKATSRITLLTFVLGSVSGPVGFAGWLVAQETLSAVGSGGGVAAAGTAATAIDVAAKSDGTQPGDTHVRIVRLSDVKGVVSLDRKTGNGFEAAMQNMPIVEGERLRTGNGYAEIEFEDNSTLRLTPDSQVDFPLLALRRSGTKASTMNVVRGTVYVNLEKTQGNEFVLLTGGAKMTVAPATHLRLEVDDQSTVVSVFNGSTTVQHGAETTLVGKKESVRLDGGQVTLAKKVADEPNDAWNKESNDYHAQYAKANSFAGSGNAYGLSDLNYYGSFINAGGCGQMWQPYFVSAGWSPYASGLWALYPGAGYSFVSPYPWGWLPFHTGLWSYCPTNGWGWQPGGSWRGLNNIATSTGETGKTGIHSPLRPALPQSPAEVAKASLVMTGGSALVYSRQDKAGNFVFQRDSAGLGVPRGSLGGLGRISNHVEQHGSASMPVYAAAPGREIQTAGHEGNSGPVTLRAGTPNAVAAEVSRPGSAGASASSGSIATSSHTSMAATASGGASASSGSHGGGSGPK